MSAPAGTSTLGKAVGQRLTGNKPGAVQAFVAAAVTGVAAAVLTYKALRK